MELTGKGRACIPEGLANMVRLTEQSVFEKLKKKILVELATT